MPLPSDSWASQMWAMTLLSLLASFPESVLGDLGFSQNGISQWDPSLVLMALTRAPFKPLSVASFQVSFWLEKSSSSLCSLHGPEGANSMRLQLEVCSMTTGGNPSPFFPLPGFFSKTQLCAKGGFISSKVGYPSSPSLSRTEHVRGSLPLSGPGSQGLPGQI